MEGEPGPERRRVHPLVRLFVWMGAIAGGLLLAAALLRPGLEGSRRASPERNASASLKTVASAQADFRGNDRDGNKKQDFWRGDVAGLYTLKPQGGTEALKLIELSIAGADAAPVTDVTAYTVKAPKAGHRFKALRFSDEDPANPDPYRFAACAFPDSPSAGRTVFVISHDNVIYLHAWSGPRDTPTVYPADPLKEGWSKLD